MIATPLDAFTSIGGAILVAATLVGGAWVMSRKLGRVWDSTVRSEQVGKQTLDAIKPENGGIGGTVTDIKNSVDGLRWQVIGLRKEVREVDAKIDAHLIEHLSHHPTGETPQQTEGP